MATVRTMQRSFSGGEVTPEYLGKIGDVYYETGLATCRNFMIKPHGPAINRPGTRFVRTVKNPAVPTRLIRFAYSALQTMAIELGAGYFRFHTNGAVLLAGALTAWSNATAYNIGDLVVSGGVNYYCILAHTNQVPPNATYWYAMPATGEYEIPNAYASTDLFAIRYTQSSDVMTLTHPNYPPMELRRYGATTWKFALTSFAPTLTAPAGVKVSGNAKGTDYFYQYVVSAVTVDNLQESVASSPAQGASSVITAATNANPGVLTTAAVHGLAVGNGLYIAGVSGMTQLNNNYYTVNTVPTTTTLTLLDTAGNVVDTTNFGVFAGGGSTAAKAISGVTNANPGVVTTSVVHGLIAGQRFTFAGVGGMTALNGNTYLVNTVISTTKISFTDLAGNVIDTTTYPAYTAGGTVTGIANSLAVAGIKNNLFATGGANTITWGAVTGADHYNIYKFSGGVYGYIGTTQGTSFTDANITADIGKTPPIYDIEFQTAQNYPGAVGYFQQRRCFAGTTLQPENMWMTNSGTESLLSYSLPILDSNRIAFRIAARDNNTIQHILPLTSLILLTSSAEWRVTSLNSDAVTPSTISVLPQSYVGASTVSPVIINNNVLYAAARGGHVRELAYSWQANGFVTADMSLRAPHLFDNLQIVDMAFAKAPFPIVWCVSSSGALYGFTYVPEQQIGAWHRHDTGNGDSFESVVAVTEGNEDAVYVIVNRTINGAQTRNVERFASRTNIPTQADAYFVDCGYTYDNPIAITGVTQATPGVVTAVAHGFSNGDPIDISDVVGMKQLNTNRYYAAGVTANTFQLQDQNGVNINTTGFGAYVSGGNARKAVLTISGATALAGMLVNILGNGSVSKQQTVSAGGVLTMDRLASKVQFGLPITAQLQTLPLAFEVQAFGQGREKNINQVYLRIVNSSGIFVGPDFNNLKPYLQRTVEAYGQPPGWKTGEVAIKLTPSWASDGAVCVQQTDPLPLDIVSMVLEASTGG